MKCESSNGRLAFFNLVGRLNPWKYFSRMTTACAQKACGGSPELSRNAGASSSALQTASAAPAAMR